MQRFFDITFSLIALILLFPFLLTIIILLKFTGEGEVFFLQERVGKSKKIFQIIKFATMIKDSPNLGTGTITIQNDPRVLRVGKFLRITKLNELPQLINILKGDMSLVGPRPLTKSQFYKYGNDAGDKISSLKPGLSGIGSIIFRNEEKYLKSVSNAEEFYENIITPYKSDLELWYVENYSTNMYFIIIFLTIWVIIFKRSNIYLKIFRGLPNKPSELTEFD